jgi:hypothetical protein
MRLSPLSQVRSAITGKNRFPVTIRQIQARRELARHYLLHSSLELNETAYLLGYEDANSFFRAFHEWGALRLGSGEPCTWLPLREPAASGRWSIGGATVDSPLDFDLQLPHDLWRIESDSLKLLGSGLLRILK